MSTQDLAQFDQLKADVAVMIPQMMAIRVVDAESTRKASESLGLVTAIFKTIEDKRDDAVRPLNERVKAINAYAKPIQAQIDGLKKHIKDQQAAYENKLMAERAEAERIRAAAARVEAERIAAIERQAAAEAQAKRDAERKKIDEEREIEAKRLATQAAAAAAFGGNPKAEEDRKAQAAKAEADRIALADRHERERLAEVARVEREREKREKAAKREAEAIAANRVKGAKQVTKVRMIDFSIVPIHYLKIELKTSEALAAYRTGVITIPGLEFYQETEIASSGGFKTG